MALPGVGGYQGGQRVDTDGTGVGGHPPVGRDCHHISQAVPTDGRPQPWVGAIDFIAGHPCGGNVGRHRTVDQRCGQCWFSRETALIAGDSGVDAARRVFGPGLGQVQSAVNQGVPAWGGVGQVHRHLGVLDPARGTRVLALYAYRVDALLDVAGLIDDQDRTPIAERVDDIVAQIITHSIGIPAGSRQQMLQPIRGRCAAVLSDGPAILAIQARDHSRHQRTGMTQRLISGETRRDPIQYRRELRLPTLGVYAMNRGDRGQFSCLHKHRTMPRSPL
jgi:hypothetical protein